MAGGADEVRVTVTVADEDLARVDQVAARLRSEGMDVEQVLEALGIITGSVPADRRERIADVPGVLAIEDETTFELPPPDSDAQ